MSILEPIKESPSTILVQNQALSCKSTPIKLIKEPLILSSSQNPSCNHVVDHPKHIIAIQELPILSSNLLIPKHAQLFPHPNQDQSILTHSIHDQDQTIQVTPIYDQDPIQYPTSPIHNPTIVHDQEIQANPIQYLTSPIHYSTTSTFHDETLSPHEFI